MMMMMIIIVIVIIIIMDILLSYTNCVCIFFFCAYFCLSIFSKVSNPTKDLKRPAAKKHALHCIFFFGTNN